LHLVDAFLHELKQVLVLVKQLSFINRNVCNQPFSQVSTLQADTDMQR